MDLLQLLKLLVGHWFVVLLTLGATGVAAVSLSSKVEPEYRANGSVVLLASATPDGGTVSVNPYTRFGTSQQVAAEALLNVMRGETFVEGAEDIGLVDTFEVGISPTGGGAIIDLSVTSKNGPSTIIQLEMLKNELQSQLADLQRRSGAPPESWITADVLSFATEPSTLTGSKKRVIVAIALLGGAIACSLAIAADSVFQTSARKQRRREERERQRAIVAGTTRPPLGADVASLAGSTPALTGNGTAAVTGEAPLADMTAGRADRTPRRAEGPAAKAQRSRLRRRRRSQGGGEPTAPPASTEPTEAEPSRTKTFSPVET